MNVHEFAELSAGHALGALSPSDEQAYLAALAEHPEWAGIADADTETAAALAEGAPPVSPPLGMRAALLRAIAADPGGDAEESPAPAEAFVDDEVDATASVDVETDATVAVGIAPEASVPVEAEPVEPEAVEVELEPEASAPVAPEPREPVSPPTEVVQAIERRNWSRGLFALAASMVLLVGIGWGTGAIANLWRTPPAVTALEQIEAAPDARVAQTRFEGGTATVHWSESLGKVVLVADGLPTLPADRTFELWYVRGESPISAGTFTADGSAATAQLTGTMQAGDTIAVTVEPSGGAPDGKPSTTPLFAVSTA